MEHQMEEDISYDLLNTSKIGTHDVKKNKTTTIEKLFICKNNQCFQSMYNNKQFK